MAKSKLDLKIEMTSGNAVKTIDKVRKATDKLKVSLEKLNNIKISYNIQEVKPPKWWEVWK